MSVKFIDGISVDGTVTVDGVALGTNAFTSTTIATNNNQLTNGAGYITPSSTSTLTNKSGNISQWTNNSGYITSGSVSNATITFSAGTGISGGGAITLNQAANETISLGIDLTEFSVGGTLLGTDYLIADNSGVNNRQLISSIPLSIFSNNVGWTTNSGTVTSVSQTHGGNAFTVGGSPITSSGTLAITMAGSSAQYINGAGNLTTFPSIPQGDITGVTAGILLDGGGTSGTVTLNVDLSELAVSTTSSDTYYFAGISALGAQNKVRNTSINNSSFNNDAGWTTNTGTTTPSNTQTFTNKSGNVSQWTNDAGYLTSTPGGDITGVTAGSGLSGGGTSGTVTLTNADKGSSQSIFKNVAVSGQSTVVADSNNDTLTFVAAGGMTITTDASTDTITFNPNDDNTNNYVTSGAYASGVLTLNRSGLSAITVTGFPTNNNALTNGAGYVTSSGNTTIGTSTNASLPTATVFNTVSLTQGVITAYTTRTLTLANLGFTGATNANYITNNNQLTNGAGYTTNVGDITGVTAGTLLDGGGTSGTVTLNVDLNELAASTTSSDTYYFAGISALGAQNKVRNTSINVGSFNNDAGYITSGSIPTVNNPTVTFSAGTGLTGGGAITMNQSNAETITFNNSITNNNQLSNGAGYVTSSGNTIIGTDTDLIFTGAKVLNTIALTDGVITAYTNRTLTLGNLGYTGATNANYITNNNQLSNGAGYVTSSGVTSVGATAPITSSGGTSPTIGVTTAAVSAGSTSLATGAQIQTAINTATTGVLTYKGTWNASTNTPTLTSGSGTTGNYYIVSTAGSTNLDGITDWALGDWAVFSDQATDAWQKIDNSSVGSVTGSGVNNRLAIWNGTGAIDSSSSFYTSGSTLYVTGGNSSQWNTHTSNTGTVTSVETTGSVSGLTLSGTVTTSGILSLGGTLSLTSANVTGGLGFTPYNATNPSGYTSNTGDITAVTAGTLLDGGGTSGSVTLSVDLTELAQSTTSSDTYNFVGISALGAQKKVRNNSIDAGSFNNNLGWTTNTGTTTPSNSQTFTNKGGNISQWTNDSGYVTSSGGSMSSWTIKEGNGVESTSVTNGETVTFAQGNGITSEMTSTTSGGTITITNTKPNVVQSTITGNAGTATTLQTARTIAGVSFNGSANISLNNSAITNGAGYVTSSGNTIIGTDTDLNFAGANVLSTIALTDGVITAYTNRAMTLGNLGYTGATNANYITNNNQLSNGNGYTTNTGTTTPSNTQTFTNKSGNVSQWTNDAGYITSTPGGDITGVTAGTGLSGGGTSGTVTLALDLGELAVGGTLIAGDYLIAENGGVDNRQLVSSIPLSIFNNNSGWTTNTGTTTASNSQTFTNKSGNISQWTNNSGYTTNVGDITAVTVGTGLDGGGTSGSVNITLDFNEIAAGGTLIASDKLMSVNGTANNTQVISSIPLSIFNNNSGWTSNTGDITAVTAGTGISGGGTSGSVTITNSAPNIHQTSVTGNAGSATVLQTTRTIAGVGFNGSGNISLNNNAITNGAGYTSNSGDITGVTAGTLLDGGGTSGTVTLNVDLSELAVSTTSSDTYYFVGVNAVGVQKKVRNTYVNVGTFNNDAGYTSNTGDITSVAAGTGMSGGGQSGAVTLNCTINTPGEVGLGNLSSSGNALSGSFVATGNITAYSDERLKTDVKTIENALDKVTQLRGVTFDKDGERGLGVIAQEIEKVLPEVVQDNEEYKSVAYGNIVGVLIEAIKEQDKKIERLEGLVELMLKNK